MPRQNGAVELGSLRGRHVKHFLNPDGTRTAEFSPVTHWWDGAKWADKVQSFRAGAAAAEWVSDSDEVTVRTYQVGQGGNRRWWVQFKDTLSGNGIEFELRFQPTTVEGSNRLDFSDGQGGTWSYYHTPQGGKMYGPPTATSRGPQSFTFTYRLLGNAPALTLNADGSISCGTLFRMERAHLEGADGVMYAGSAWTLGSGTLSFSYNDTSLPTSAYPYRVDPSTVFTQTVSLDDQRVGRFGAASFPPTSGTFQRNTTETTSSISNTLATTYRMDQLLIRFDTSSLDNAATVQSATLRLFYTGTSTDTNGRSVVGDYYAWDGSSNSDWTDAPSSGAFSTALSAITASQHIEFPLSTPTNISLTGYTSLRIGISGSTPTGANNISFNTGNNSENKPQLIVDYTVGGATVQTFTPVSADDQGASRPGSASYPPTGSVSRNTTGAVHSVSKDFTTVYVTRVYLFKVDTSAINDAATVTGAILRLFCGPSTNTNARNLVGEWYTWDGSSDSDHTNTPGSNAFSVSLGAIVGDAYNDFTLSTPTNVSKTGVTYLRVAVDGGQPTGLNTVAVSSADNAANKPALIVDFEVDVTPPAAPSGLGITVYR